MHENTRVESNNDLIGASLESIFRDCHILYALDGRVVLLDDIQKEKGVFILVRVIT